jgi:putative DNA primase/helicase
MGAGMNFQMLANLANGKLGIVDATCPLCSHDRRRPNQNKKVLRLWCDIRVITFCCVHCGAKGYVLDDDRHKLTQADHDRIRQRRAESERYRQEDRKKRSQIAAHWWHQGIDPRGTPAEAYLASRRLTLTDAAACAELRFHPACVWHVDPNHPAFPGGWHPTLLAAFRSIETDELTGIHRIRVDRPQLWPKTMRKMLGPVSGSAIKLADVTDTLAIGEGIETCLAANQMGYGPAWAVGCADAVANLPVLKEITHLILLRENDAASHEATQRCANRWIGAGRKVNFVVPDVGKDLNDELMMSDKQKELG